MSELREVDRLTERVIGAAIEVHRVLGPGLLEAAYEQCLLWELEGAGLEVRRQVLIPVLYKGKSLNDAFRIDLLVNNTLIVELKSVDEIAPVHVAQVLTYLRLTRLTLGLILNFKVDLMRKGVRRVINDLV